MNLTESETSTEDQDAGNSCEEDCTGEEEEETESEKTSNKEKRIRRKRRTKMRKKCHNMLDTIILQHGCS